VAFDECGSQSSRSGIEGHTQTGDSAPDDHDIKLLSR
jgi:hypothetical protein